MSKSKYYQLATVQAPNASPASTHSALSPQDSGLLVPSSSPVPDLASLIKFRPYQLEAFQDRSHGIELWLWGRQTGKSFTLAAWAVDRLITIPGRTVTVISNSKRNGIELNRKCAEICNSVRQAFEQVDLTTERRFETLRAETRITIKGQVGRILIIAPNLDTARGFTGDLILDEFAFQENSSQLWEDVKPILDSNKDFLCRIASTPNGKHNQFYRMVTDPFYFVRKITRTDAFAAGCPIFHPMTRESITPAQARELARNKRAYDQNYECAFEDESMALLTYDLINSAERPDVGVICEYDWSPQALSLLSAPYVVPPLGGPSPSPNPLPSGLRVHPDPLGTVKNSPPSFNLHPSSFNLEKKPINQWLAEAPDQTRMYRHILMNVFNGSIDRIHQFIENNTPIALNEVYNPFYVKKSSSGSSGRQLFVGIDVGRHNDRTVITVVERSGNSYLVRAILRLSEMRLPQQQERLERILRLPDVRHAKIDMTGIGLGLCEYTRERFPTKISGVNFSRSVPSSSLAGCASAQTSSPPMHSTVRITEYLATQLLQRYEDRAIQHPIDAILRDDLRKPERFISANGRVSIAATRTESGHADHFWSLALAIEAAQAPIQKPLEYHAWTPKYRQRIARL